MPTPASSERSPGPGTLRAALAPAVPAHPGADRVPWTVVWAGGPQAEGLGTDAAAAHGHAGDARLVWAGPRADAPREVLERVPAEGWVRDAVRVSAPLMDHHVHGGAGVDLATSPTEEARAWLTAQRRAGVSAVLGSLPALSPAGIPEALERLRPLWEEGVLAGVHLEGPFLSPARAGAHDPALLCAPDSDAGREVRALLRAQPRGLVRTMTLAPELDGSAELEAELREAGIVPCCGHSDVDAAGARAVLERWGAGGAGAGDGSAETAREGHPAPRPVVTHLFNALRAFHHRDPGPLPALLGAARRGRLRLELIADDVHVDPELVDQMLADPSLSPALCLISDAVAATGAARGSVHRLGPHAIHAGDDAPRLGRPTSSGVEDGGQEPTSEAGVPPLAGGCRSLADSVVALLRRGADADAVLRAATTVPRESLADGASPAWRAGVEGSVLVWRAEAGPVVVEMAPAEETSGSGV